MCTTAGKTEIEPTKHHQARDVPQEVTLPYSVPVLPLLVVCRADVAGPQKASPPPPPPPEFPFGGWCVTLVCCAQIPQHGLLAADLGRAADQRQARRGRDSAQHPLRVLGSRAPPEPPARQLLQQDHRESHRQKDRTGDAWVGPVRPS